MKSDVTTIWTKIGKITEALLREPERDELIRVRASGKRFQQFPPEILGRLQQTAFDHWDVVASSVPERCTHKINIAERAWWEKILTDELGDDAVHRVLWWFVPYVGAASRMILAASRRSAPEAQSRQYQLENFIGYAIGRWRGMRDLIHVSPPESTVRWLYYHDMFPRYTKDVTQSKLNRAISEARRNGELVILGPRLEALEAGLQEYATTFVEHPQGNRTPKEPSALNQALNGLFPYLDQSITLADEKGEIPPSQGSPTELVVSDASKTATWNGKRLEINSNSDFDVLQALYASKGRLVRYQALLSALGTEKLVVGKNAPPEVKDPVHHINAAFVKSDCPYYVENVRSTGYRLVSRDE